ncbi:MAG: hypothetical protein V2A73_12665 [Pseudomonadota bacterium]
MAATKKKPGKRSPRVRAWVYGVLNALIDALEREHDFLSRGNLTWRHYSGRAEYILLPEEYLDPAGQTNLEDVENYYPEVKSALQTHRQLLTAARDAAATAHKSLVQDSAFHAAVTREIDRYKVAKPSAPYLSESPDAILRLAAERVVNEIRDLPDHYTDADFWNFAATALTTFSSSEIPARARVAREALAQHTVELVQLLRELRTRLCDDFDIPPAPWPAY